MKANTPEKTKEGTSKPTGRTFTEKPSGKKKLPEPPGTPEKKSSKTRDGGKKTQVMKSPTAASERRRGKGSSKGSVRSQREKSLHAYQEKKTGEPIRRHAPVEVSVTEENRLTGEKKNKRQGRRIENW